MRGQARPDTARWLADVVGISHVAQSQLVDHSRPEGLGVAQVDELRPSEIQCGESWHARSTLPGRIRIVQRVIIGEIIARNQSTALSVGVHPKTPLVVPQNLPVRARRKCGIPRVGQWNVWQQVLAWFRPRPLGNDRVRKYAQFGRRAARKVVRLVCGNPVAEFLGQKIGEIGAANTASERIRLIREIAGAVANGRDWNQAAVDALILPRALIVPEKE